MATLPRTTCGIIAHGVVALFALASSTLSTIDASAADNPFFTFPLHATVSVYEQCNGYLPMDCQTIRPRVTVPPDTTVVVFWFLANYSQAAAVQTAFQWPSDWSLLFGLWADCVPGIPPAVVPQNPGGPVTGAICFGFLDCLAGPSLRVLGRMTFQTGLSGCLTHTVPLYPGGIWVMDCSQEVDTVDPDQEPARLGSICVGTSGIDACDRVTAANDNTWGGIKAAFIR